MRKLINVLSKTDSDSYLAYKQRETFLNNFRRIFLSNWLKIFEFIFSRMDELLSYERWFEFPKRLKKQLNKKLEPKIDAQTGFAECGFCNELFERNSYLGSVREIY